MKKWACDSAVSYQINQQFYPHNQVFKAQYNIESNTK